jgi:hypothetical protein
MLTPQRGAHPLTRGQQSTARKKPRNVPKAPASLGADEAKVWKETCAAQNAEWLDTGPGPLLEDYCYAVVEGRRLRSLVRIATTNPDNKDLAPLSLVERLEMVSKTKERLARALRLTPQSRIRADKAEGSPRQPWESGDEGDSE